MKRIAIATTVAALSLTGLGLLPASSASAASAYHWENLFIGSFSSASECAKEANIRNVKKDYPDVYDQYYYCGSAGNLNLWVRAYFPY